MSERSSIAIVGAGPYGLSIAAHLRAHGVDFRIFGRPMHNWRTRMPAGMCLKSQGFASSLSDPTGRFTLGRFWQYGGDGAVPIPLETFVAYGLSFQRRLVPQAEENDVVALDRSAGGFVLELADGEAVEARRVVVAVGATYFAAVPPAFAHLSRTFVSHSSEHHDLGRFRGRDVTILGGGASAVDLAGLLHETGAAVRLVARRPALVWMDTPVVGRRPLWQRIRRPSSGLGLGPRLRFYEEAPMLFHRLPRRTRIRLVQTTLGPAGAWFMKDRIVGRVPMLLGYALGRAEARDGRVQLELDGADGRSRAITTDHVVAATGYAVDVRRIPFLGPNLCAAIATVDGAPVLSASFESSVPGLYFVGLAAANEFGPSMRFVLGARYTARRLCRHLSATEWRIRSRRMRLPIADMVPSREASIGR